MFGESVPPDLGRRRYGTARFPPYRYVPGFNPHPVSDPAGHSYGKRDPTPPPWDPADWRRLEPYLYGIDLFNEGYWWECHETLEGLWRAAGRTSVPAQFLQGIIQVAAAYLNRRLGRAEAARSKLREGVDRLRLAAAESRVYMGVDLPAFVVAVEASFPNPLAPPAEIRLAVDDPRQTG